MTMEKTEKKYFLTRDLNLAAVLISLKFNLVMIDYQIEGDRSRPVGYFNFIETPELIKAEKLFWRKELAIEPRELMDNLRALKTQLATEYKSPKSKFNQN